MVKMIFLPEIMKKDELHGLIYLSEWVYKSKYALWVSYFCILHSVLFLCRCLYYMVTAREKLFIIDTLFALLIVEMILSCLSLYDERKTSLEVRQTRTQYFWDNAFLGNLGKLEFYRVMKLIVYPHYLLWISAIVLAIFMGYTPYVFDHICPEDWSYLTKFAGRLYLHLVILFGIYLGTTHECFFAYNILHAYLQLNTVSAYLRQEFCRYEKMTLEDKMYSYKYQTLIRGVLLRCIKQHKKLTDYGKTISNIYNRWMIYHFLIAVMVFSVALYGYIFDDLLGYKSAIVVGILQFLLLAGLYNIVGDLFADGYEDFHKELLNVQWYSLNRANRQLYYMFLIFTQREYHICILPSLPITRPLACRFVKLVYSGVAVLASLRKNNIV